MEYVSRVGVILVAFVGLALFAYVSLSLFETVRSDVQFGSNGDIEE